MSSAMELRMFISAGEDLFASLEQETLACLKNLESMSPQEIENFCEHRQGILNEIEKFNVLFNQHIERFRECGDDASLEIFRQRQGALLSRIIKADGLLKAIAEIGLKSLKSKQSIISRGRQALHGYRKEGGKLRISLKRIV